MIEVIELGGMKTVKTEMPTNHVYVVDVSGSMYRDLPEMRSHLKNTISLVAKPNDTFSVIYFSGKGQCGVVFENMKVDNLDSIRVMHESIDKYLKTIGLTGFTDPMKLAMNIANNFDKTKTNNFVMLTDGYDNCSKKDDIVDIAKTLPTIFDSVTFIEYGYYCDRELLQRMAETAAGIHIFADGYLQYTSVVEEAFNKALRVPKVSVKVNKNAKHVVYVLDNKIHIIPVEQKGEVLVPETVERVHSIVPKDVLSKHLSEDHLFLILYYAVKTNNSKLVWNCLDALGDVALIKQYTNCYTKDEAVDFEDSVEYAALNKFGRFVEGKDLSYMPPKNAYTVIDLMNLLADDENAALITDSPSFKYKSTTRKRENEQTLPRFVKAPQGTSKITGVVFNSSRPNVSLQTIQLGSIELPENDFDLKYVPSQQFKNYTVIKDGVLNIVELPLVLSTSSVEELKANKVPHDIITEDGDICYIVVELSTVPVINRNMIEKLDKDWFLENIRTLLHNQAAVKVIKSLLPEEEKLKVDGLKEKYGEDAATWLSSIGVRDYGFSPVGSKSVESTDFYISNELEYKIKSFSSLPSVNAVIKKIEANKKRTPSESLIEFYLDYESLTIDELKDYLKTSIGHARKCQENLASQVYSIVLGKAWFKDEDEPMVAELDIIDGITVPVTVQRVQKEIKI